MGLDKPFWAEDINLKIIRIFSCLNSGNGYGCWTLGEIVWNRRRQQGSWPSLGKPTLNSQEEIEPAKQIERECPTA